MDSPHTIGLFRGSEISPWLEDVARLRIGVFRAFDLSSRAYNWWFRGRSFEEPTTLSAPLAIPLSDIESVAQSKWFGRRITIRSRSGDEYRFDFENKKQSIGVVAKIEACRKAFRSLV